MVERGNCKMVDLNSILNELEAHHRNRDGLMKHYVEMRLNKSIQSYYEQIMASVDGIETINTNRVVRKLSKSIQE